MTTRHLKWTAAFAVSTALHAGAVGLFMMQSEETVQIAGGQPVVLSIQGNAMEDQVSAGEAVEATDTAEPVEPDQEVAAVQPETVQPQAEPVQPETVEPEPVETPPDDVAEPVEREETPPEPVEEAVPVPPDAVPPPEAQDTAAVEPETLAPLPEDELALVDVPVPTPRPEYTPPPPPRQQAQRTERPRQQQPAPRQQGSSGQNQADTRRGTDQGSTSGSSAPSGAGQANAAGNAAVSNYPGQIATRLRRALQYPREAQRQGIRGEVHVRFTVSAGGQASGITVARSSGSPVLDQAAIATVQRASPFPAIPAGAGRASWPFTVPLVFSR
ncbi:energy transducer TonB family protein [Aliihoeflea sp. PC F10.4]